MTAPDVGRTLVDAHVAGVDEMQTSAGSLGQTPEDLRPKPRVPPAGKVAIDGSPADRRAGHIAPRTTGAQKIKQRPDHRLQNRARSPSPSPPLMALARLWWLYAGRASAPSRNVCDRSLTVFLSRGLPILQTLPRSGTASETQNLGHDGRSDRDKDRWITQFVSHSASAAFAPSFAHSGAGEFDKC